MIGINNKNLIQSYSTDSEKKKLDMTPKIFKNMSVTAQFRRLWRVVICIDFSKLLGGLADGCKMSLHFSIIQMRTHYWWIA